MNEWTEILDNGGSIESVYMDFMKAFDKIPYKRLMKKMERYGINNKTIFLQTCGICLGFNFLINFCVVCKKICL
jgi:hypothetical protein